MHDLIWDIGMHLHLIANVNDECVGNGIDIEPLALMLHLKPRNLILYEKGQQAVIRMRRQADCKFRLRTRRIQVCNEDLETRFQIQGVLYVGVSQTQAH